MNISSFLFKSINAKSFGLFRFTFYLMILIFYCYFSPHILHYGTWFESSLVSFYKPISFFSFLSHDQLFSLGNWNLEFTWKISMLAAALGLFFPISSWFSFLGLLYMAGVPLNFGKVHHVNHMPVVVLGIMALQFNPGGLSLDHFFKRILNKAIDQVNIWALQTSKIYMTMAYFSSGYQKMKNGGLSWITSDNMQSIILTRSVLTPVGSWVAQFPVFCKLLALLTVTIDLAAPLALFSSKLRKVIIPVLFFFHIGTFILLGYDGYFFPYCLCYLVWLPWERIYSWVLKGRSCVLLGMALFFEKASFLSKIVALIYLKILLPCLSLILRLKHGDSFILIPRHSLLKSTFNPFLSDIDFSLVIKKGHEERIDPLVTSFITLNSFSKIFDLPQVYLEEEWDLLVKVSEDTRYNFFWNYRKITWIKSNTHDSAYEKYKKERARKISEKILFVEEVQSLHSLSSLSVLFPRLAGHEACVYSSFLELTSDHKILLSNSSEIQFLYSILPGFNDTEITLSEEWQTLRETLWIKEYYLNRSHGRVQSRLGNDLGMTPPFIRELEKSYPESFKLRLVLEGEKWDLFKGRS